MGWDAYATKKNGETLKWTTRSPYRIMHHPKYRKEFEQARDEVLSSAGTVDWMLPIGGLDCSACAEMIEKATSETCWTETPWPPERVRLLNGDAYWGFDYTEDEAWAYHSAKQFLQTCATLGLGIKFSF